MHHFDGGILSLYFEDAIFDGVRMRTPYRNVLLVRYVDSRYHLMSERISLHTLDCLVSRFSPRGLGRGDVALCAVRD